ncbi:uncharacterized protein [Engystomops pustulosus]|uniref:uncharacterized protein isoform X2 n=1 Tax=Engystomops pustulosus TaxID=76066 RepID=UPI003AFACFF3
MAVQGPITFQNVAATFAHNQWLHLEDWQKEIYKTVIKEIHEAIISLGYTIINPNIVFSVRKPGEPSLRIDDQLEEKCTDPSDLPDLLLKVHYDPPVEAVVVVEKPQILDPVPSSSTMTSAYLLNVKEEIVSLGQPDTGLLPKKSNAFPVKTEEEVYPIRVYASADGVKQPILVKGDDLVKSEEETDTEEDFQGTNGGVHDTEDSASGIELKRIKLGSQVCGDILSLQEREARRLRVMVGDLPPEQPAFMSDPNKPHEVKNENPEARKDIKTTTWCKCGNCCVMPTLEESVCCHEITGLISKLSSERVCITSHPAFKELCLDQDRLDFLYRFLAKIKRKNDILYHLHKLRRTAYRAFVVWAHGFLDFRNFKPIPACVVHQVQEYLPYPEDINVGYMKMYDYPAAIMALDHI